MTWSPDERLILTCAVVQDAFEEAPADFPPADPARFMELATHHCLSPLCYWALRNHLDALGPVGATLREHFRVNFARSVEVLALTEEVGALLNAQGIVVLGSGADEAPGAYRQLRPVLEAHDNIAIEHWLTPLGVIMAGPNEYDPYRD